MAHPRSYDADDQVPDANETDNIQVSEVVGNKADDPAAAVNNTNSIVSYVKAVFTSTVGGGQIIWQQSDAPSIDEAGGMAYFQVGVVDRDTGPIAAGSIDISAAVVSLAKSTSGGAFSTVGVTQPTVAKSTGVVSISYDFIAGEWTVGDVYRLTLTTVTATNSASGVEYMPPMAWVGEIVQDLDVKTAVDTIQTNTTRPAADSTANIVMADVLGNKDDVANTTAGQASVIALVRALVQTYASTTGTADSGTTTTMVDAALTQTDADYWEGMQIIFTSGPNFGQGRPIVDFDPGTDTITVAPAFTQAVAAGHTYAIVSIHTLPYIKVALNATGVSISTNSLADQLYIGAAEQLRSFIANTGGTAVASGKSLLDALGTNGTTVADSAVSVLGAIGADNANNAFASTNVVANRDGSILERLEDVRTQLTMDTTVAAHTQTAAGGTGEQQVFADTTSIGHIQAHLDLSNLTENVTVKTYLYIGGSPILVKSELVPDPAAGTIKGWYSDVFLTSAGLRVTLTSSVAEGADRTVNYRVMVRDAQ